MATLPNGVRWPCMTIRDLGKHRLWLSVDSLMDLRNSLGTAQADQGFLDLLDHIIVTAQRADVYGRGVG